MTHSGEIIWAQRFGGPGEDNLAGMDIDYEGNIYISGFIGGLADFGPIQLTGYGGPDAFVCRITTEGEVKWALAGGSYFTDRAYRVSVSPNKAFVAFSGYYNGSAIFGPFTLPYASNKDAFVAKVDTAGFYEWVFASGNDESDHAGYGVTIDNSQNIYVAGYFFSSTWEVGPFTLINSSFGNADCSLIKLSHNAQVIFAKSFGGPMEDLPRPIVAKEDYLYIGGYHYGQGNFLGVPLEGHTGYIRDSYVLKSDTSGEGIWAMDGVSSSDDELIGMYVNEQNNLYISGGFKGDMMIGASVFSSNGMYDAYAIRINGSTGIAETGTSGGGTGNDIFFGMGGNNNDLFTAGYFEVNAIFDSTTLISAGYRDIFIAKFDDPIVTTLNDRRTHLKLYPNPCDDNFILSISDSPPTIYSILLYNMLGEKIKEARLINENEIRISCIDLSPGYYILRVIDENGIATSLKLKIE